MVPVCPTRACSSDPIATTRMPTCAGVESAKVILTKNVRSFVVKESSGSACLPALGAECLPLMESGTTEVMALGAERLPLMESGTTEVTVFDAVPVQQGKTKTRLY